MNITIPMVDPAAWHQSIQSELEEAAVDVLRSGRFVMGELVESFEKEAAHYLGVKYALACANGTDALVLALQAAGIGVGDEVLTTGFTFFATAEAIMQVGASPVLVDIDPKTFNLDPAELERAISPRSKAVLVVHLFGQPADLSSIQSVCEQHGLLLLEDCAQSFGAEYKKKQTGTFGIAGTFSFFPSKNLGGFGDGGMITTNNKDVADKIRQLRNHGSSEQYIHDTIGYNSRLDEIQAALLRVKLKHIDHFNRQRQSISRYYREALGGSDIIIPHESSEGTHIYHQYTVVLPSNRDLVRKRLARKGVASAVYYPLPLHRQKALQPALENRRKPELPMCEQLAEHCLSLPIYPGMTREQIDSVTEVLLKSVKA
ncbi:erythromycin biosynthesis sensory transduction protein eryC1 [Endozoicomonas sp. (ex Bugula neritina AB1)]|nr:erythromycin biosynthesis sensory transduction protein eryC1 [Endozoicomonas sp. (ex Bugula neritina AB1)]